MQPEKKRPKTEEKLHKVRETSDVIVDFIFQRGLLFIAIQNMASSPAYRVRVEFDKPIRGLGGGRVISALPLFQNIEFLAPHKEIVTFLDASEAYFTRGEPTRINLKISYDDRQGVRRSTTITHDLEIYREITYLPGSVDGASLRSHDSGLIE